MFSLAVALLICFVVSFVAVLPSVSAAGNINCTVFPRVSVPSDFIPIFNMYQVNDTHVEMPDETNYDWTLACKSNITTLNNTCADEYVNITSLYQTTDSHVSIDDYYYNLGHNICLSTADSGVNITKTISGSTPSDMECMFGTPTMNDSHVFNCSGATYKVNVNVTSTVTTNCTDVDGDGFGIQDENGDCTYNQSVDCDDNNANVYPPFYNMTWDKDITFCPGTYVIPDAGDNQGIVNTPFADDVVIRCNDTRIYGGGSGNMLGYVIGNNVTVKDCVFANYTTVLNIAGKTDLNITNNTFENTTPGSLAVYIQNGVRNKIVNNIFVNGDGGVQTINEADLLIQGNAFTNYTNSAMSLYRNTRTNVTDNTIINYASGRGMSIYGANAGLPNINTTVTGNNITGGDYGVYLYQHLYNLTMINNRFVDADIAGIRIVDNVKDGTFTNNTFESNPTALIIAQTSSVGNIFYYNRFLNSTTYHADVIGAGNFFNTTNGSSCGAQCARGNFWDDILDNNLDILDSNGDGYGDSGTQYPYNSTNGGDVSGPLTDFGPMVSVPPVTTDNYTLSDRDWNMEGADIKLTAVDADFDYVEYCYFSIYGTACIPVTQSSNNPETVSLGCPYNAVCQYILRYHSVDLAGNNETYHDTSQINLVNNSEIYNTSVWNSSVYNQSYIIDSDVNDSVVDGCYIENSMIINSTVKNDTGCRYPCHIVNTTVIDSNLTCTKALNSYVDPSYVYDSFIDNSTLNSTNLTSSLVGNTTFMCSDVDVVFGRLVDSVFTAGQITYNVSAYYPVLPLQSICSGLASISIVYPSPGSVVNGTFDIVFISSENRSAEISIDGGTWASSTGWDYSTWDTTTLQDGSHTFRIRDQDEIGQYVYSNVITVTVQNAVPGITIIDPSSSEIVYGNQTVKALAADYIKMVEWYLVNGTGNYGLDGTLSVTTNDTDGSDGWSGTWQTGNFGEGYYNLTAVAYDRTFFGSYTVDVNTTKTGLYIDNTPPVVSVEIIGSNGTTLTTVPQVILNLSYSDVDDELQCRYANELSSLLATTVWEECTTAKEWLLASGEGLKTVYVEVKDRSGNNITVSDTITYSSVQDTTPPTAPVVYDGQSGSDADWWNDNSTFGAYWFNATEDISTLYYRYRLLENGINITSWSSPILDDEGNYTGQNLLECSNYSMEVIATNPSGYNSTAVTSDGAILDVSPPEEPVINSTTHPIPGVIYGSGDVKLNFSSVDADPCGQASGVAGYSYLFDRYPGTAPDDVVDSEPYISLVKGENTGYEQLLKTEGSGVGYLVQTEVAHNLSENDTLKIRVAIAEDGEETKDQLHVGVIVSDDACQYTSCPTVLGGIEDKYVDVSYAYDLQRAKVYEFTYVVNADVTDGSFFIGVAGFSDDDDNVNNHSIVGTNDPDLVDNTTTTRVCDESDTCSYNASIEYAISVEVKKEAYQEIEYTGLTDGTYYFHAKALDNAGNWGETEHFEIDVDTEGVGVDVISPFNNQMISDDHVDVIVEVNEQANVEVVVLYPDGTNDTSSTVLVNDTYTFNGTLEEGVNEIYAVATHPQTGVVTTSNIVRVIQGDYYRATNKTLRIAYSGAGSSQAHMRYVVAGDQAAGIASENDGAVWEANAVTQDTSIFETKIFVTDPAMPVSTVEGELADDDFLDQTNPLFGFKRNKVGEYLIGVDLHSPLAYFEGDKKVGDGNYRLVFKNVGYTPDGRANITVTIT